MGLLFDEFNVVYVGGPVPFSVNNFMFPEAKRGKEREEVNIYVCRHRHVTKAFIWTMENYIQD